MRKWPRFFYSEIMETKGRSKVKVSSSCFPEDVLVAILSRLPVKSLLRFKCVSKEWKALITSTYFTAIHLQNSDPNLSLLLTCPLSNKNENSLRLLRNINESTLLSLDLPFRNPNTRWLLYPVGSSNGLVCFTLHSGGVHRGRVVIWNPATKEFKYHHHLHPHYQLLGFEYFHDTRDYKVVAILPPGSDNLFRARVLTSSTDYWREVRANNCSLQRPTQPYDYITLNGVLYMCLWTLLPERRPAVLSFNLRNEVFYVIPLPERINHINSLFPWKNSLALLAGQEDELREVWMMTEEPSAGTTQMSWVKQFIIEPSLPFTYIGGSWKEEYLIGYYRSDRYEDVYCYHPASQKLIKLLLHDQRVAYCTCHFKAFNYVESLVSVD